MSLWLNKKFFEENLEAAMKNGEELCGEELDEAAFELEKKFNEVYLDDDEQEISASYSLLDENGNDVGSDSIQIPLSADLMVQIIENYRKKLAKLKSAFEVFK